ncbi:MAG: phosphotransferase family protein [Steroidobacteraceae bacterium]
MSDLGPRIAEWFAADAPGRRQVRTGPLVPPGDGYSNVTLMGQLDWIDEAGHHVRDFVLRLQPPGDSIFPGHDVERQYRVMEALARADVPVPRLLGLELDEAVLGGPFYLMERIEGQVPNENPLYHLEGWFHDLPPAQVRRYWFAGIEAAGSMARLNWRDRGLDFLGVSASPLDCRLDYYAEAVRWAEGLVGRKYPLLHRAEAWLRAHLPTDEPLGFCWGDAKLGNCLFRDGELVGVLDFEQASLGNPVDDLAWWLMLDDALSRGYDVPRLASLPGRDESIAAWERASGLAADHLEYYEVYAAWRMAFIMARIAALFRARGWIPADSDMDERNGGSALLAIHAQHYGF